MPKYMYVFRGVEASKTGLTAEEHAAVMRRWSKWAATFREKDMIRDGSPLEPDGVVVDGSGVVSDGPFVESKELIGGYFVIECDNLAEAAELARGCPGLEHAGMTVEVRAVRGA